MKQLQKFRFRSVRLILLYIGLALVYAVYGTLYETIMLALLAVLIAGQVLQLGPPVHRIAERMLKEAAVKAGMEEESSEGNGTGTGDPEEELSEDGRTMLVIGNGNLNVLLCVAVVALGKVVATGGIFG